MAQARRSPHRASLMKPPGKTPPNPILATALGMIEGVASGALDDPEKALRDLVPRLRFLVVEGVENPTIPQLEALRAFESSSSLVEIRKALQAGKLRFGPFPGDWAERAIMPRLVQLGLPVLLRALTKAEKAEHLGGVRDEGGQQTGCR